MSLLLPGGAWWLFGVAVGVSSFSRRAWEYLYVLVLTLKTCREVRTSKLAIGRSVSGAV